MATVTIIQPNTATIINKVRVAAYCRVSSSSDDQLNSYQAQLTYYSHKFENSDTEELIDLYADEGITGTRESLIQCITDISILKLPMEIPASIYHNS